MDIKQEFENLKNELRQQGFDENKLNQLLDLATEEAIDLAVQDAEDLDDQELEGLANIMNQTTNTQEEALQKINTLFVKVYKDQAENKKYSFLNQFLKEALETTKQVKDLTTRYQNGDPTAVAKIQSNIGNPDAEKIKSLM